MLNENYKKRMQQLAGIDMFKGCEIDNNVVLFCENKITEVEFLNYINSNHDELLILLVVMLSLS